MTTHETAAPRPRAVLAAVRLPEVSEADHEAAFAELRRLVDTLGFDVVGTVSQNRPRLDPGAVFGKGKLLELAGWTGGTGEVVRGPRKRVAHRVDDAYEDDWDDESDEAPADAFDEDDDVDVAPPPQGADLVVVDHELSPMQLRNLERALGVEVLDRTGVIVDIFHRHARSREARLQVEIARLTYLAPRLRESSGQRQRGGIGQKGAGESAVELDRRKIRDRIAELRQELASIEGESKTRRARRQQALRCALVGYTNAGKSSMMRALTGSEVYVADKLFATLDTTVRALWPETKPRILVSDTVGFIKKLPHDLVASFRSTLDEALEASLILHLVDASDPDFRNQLRVTLEVLGDIGAGEVPRALVLNKADRLDDAARAALMAEFPDARLSSAKSPDAVHELRGFIVDWFLRDMPEVDLFVPWAAGDLVGEVRKLEVLDESHEDDGTRYRVRGPHAAIERLQGALSARQG